MFDRPEAFACRKHKVPGDNVILEIDKCLNERRLACVRRGAEKSTASGIDHLDIEARRSRAGEASSIGCRRTLRLAIIQGSSEAEHAPACTRRWVPLGSAIG